jgi:ATP-dependent Clp protease, protease subunit
MNFITNYSANTLYEGIYKELLQNRILYINDDIGDQTIDMIATPINLLNELEKDIATESLSPITIWLNSYGGSADACLYIIDTIQKSRIPIHIKVMAIAASAGLYICIAGHKRIANKNSIFLLHKGSISLQGNSGDAEDTIAFYKEEVGKVFDDLIISRTNITAEELKKIRRNETYCMGEQAIEYGFIDEIV